MFFKSNDLPCLMHKPDAGAVRHVLFGGDALIHGGINKFDV